LCGWLKRSKFVNGKNFLNLKAKFNISLIQKIKIKLFIIVILFSNISISQIVIQMQRKGGVSYIPCKVNGLKLSFVFDTGASDVTISLTEAKFMLKNGYLTKDDIIGTANYSNANGEISEGIVINIKEIDIQGLKLYNVRASIVKNMEAPLLLGQSAISKLGTISINLTTNTLTINKNNGNYETSSNCIDFDGRIYPVVKIGDQVWMQKNLDVSHFNNGDLIFEAKTENQWKYAAQNKIPAWRYYLDNSKSRKTLGKLYNGWAIKDSRKITPLGFHIPNKIDWLILVEFLGGTTVAVNKMKNTFGWEDVNSGKSRNGNNLSNFSVYQSASIYDAGIWSVDNTSFWGLSEISNSGLFFISIPSGPKSVISYYNGGEGEGYNIRCIKN
jgi:clan AA aspartic protease (TIGR02281 family)